MVLHNGRQHLTAEEIRLQQDREKLRYWKRWGPYLSERQWATVREDYSANGDAWSDFPFEHARSRTYRWGEDGICGVSDNHQFQCISFAFWNEKDDLLKERMFGLTGHQGNHGEDVKEVYFYLDNTPSHSYMKYLYKYPQKRFPYEKLVEENARRSRNEPEYEITDTGVFDENRYFDIFVEMAKDDNNEEELLFRVTAYNRGPEAAPLHIVPQAWFRNTWSWGTESEKNHPVPEMSRVSDSVVRSKHYKLGDRYFVFPPSPGINSCTDNHDEDDEDEVETSGSDDDIHPRLMFTDNETNNKRLYGVENKAPYVKDGFHDLIVEGDASAVNPAGRGTKVGAWYAFDDIPAGDFATVRFKFTNRKPEPDVVLNERRFDRIMDQREDEADDFYYQISPLPVSDELRRVQRQALAGMLWTKQFYHFVHTQWATGDPANPPPPPERAAVRNQNWRHLHIDDILSMPDKWEYPFFAAWDTAFHCLPLAMVDPEFSKKQLDLLTREWYMHPNGQVPAYEWNFSDVNPPVHAWATFRVFKMERKMYGRSDLNFLERVFQKLLLNFTWWVNRKDMGGKNVFEGGFLGLDNIGLFNRSEPLPTGGVLEQADSTGWMAFFCLQMLNIALELSKTRSVYEDIASKFFEHFLFIADAMSFRDGDKIEKSLWNDTDGFYYDAISWGGPWSQQLPVRSLVGLIPLYACLTLEPQVLNKFQSFSKRVKWFADNRPDITGRNIASVSQRGSGERLLLSLVNRERLVKILERMLDEDEFLSDYGIRSMSKFHKDHPYSMEVNGQNFTVDYVPGDSNSGLFGGNSNWRGPIWFPTTFLLIESLQRFYMYYGDSLEVECPKGSGNMMNLARVAENIQHRLMSLFIRDADGSRPCDAHALGPGHKNLFEQDEHFRDYVRFHEYFEADTGRGLGSEHQCGWTALVAKLIHDTGVSHTLPRTPKTPIATAEHFFDDEITTPGGPISHGGWGSKRHRLQRRMSARSRSAAVSENDDDDDRESVSSATSDYFGAHRSEDIAEHIRKSLERLNTRYDDELEARHDDE